jgi:hypothetical protein
MCEKVIHSFHWTEFSLILMIGEWSAERHCLSALRGGKDANDYQLLVAALS